MRAVPIVGVSQIDPKQSLVAPGEFGRYGPEPALRQGKPNGLVGGKPLFTGANGMPAVPPASGKP
jgi:hypothetical protein